MNGNKTGCLICGKPLQYFEAAKELECAICGRRFETNASCPEGHYICDKCHAQKGFDEITRIALKAVSRNPFAIARDCMENDFIHMHGPEHHYLVVASLLSAYKNAGGGIDLKPCLDKALQRARNVPGGVCGLWGSCGAGISSGMFISIITGATPLSEKEWSLANLMTSRTLKLISENGGPRCCKRNTYLALISASAFVKEQFGIEMEAPENLKCGFYSNNKQCRKAGCLFWPGAESTH